MALKQLRVTVRQSGHLEFIYHDDLAGLCSAGTTVITRASHVEPSPHGGWTADMAPSGGPLLGPFPTRAEALAHEVSWLQSHRGL